MAPEGPARYDPGASDTEIRFASVSSITGVISDMTQPEGARAYFKFVNDKFGGVDGRKLTLNIYDDQWDVTRNAALVRQAVEKDKVFAFVASVGILTNHGAAPYLEEKKIPVIGGDHADIYAWGASPMFFPTAELEAYTGGRLMGRWAVAQGCKRPAAQSANVETSLKWTEAFKKGLEDAGLTQPFVYEGQNSLAETDFTAYAARIKAANADCLTQGQPDTAVLRMRTALRQVGHELRMFECSCFYSGLIREKGDLFEGDFGLNPSDIPENSANPVMAEVLAHVSMYEPKIKGKLSNFGLTTYASAKVAVEVLRRMGNDLTRENLFQALYSTKNLDVGLVPPISYQPGVNEGQKCGYIITMKNRQFQMVNPRACL